MKSARIIVVLIINLFVVSCILEGCSKEQTSEPTKSIAGTYASSSLTISDAADQAVDVQSAGGSIQMTLTDRYEYTATLTIPQNISTTLGSGITETYSGVFSLVHDTITFDTAGFIVCAMEWDEGNNSLTSISPARGTTSFLLKKK
jgi:hypothetical protein